jgi:hypothetical protein
MQFFIVVLLGFMLESGKHSAHVQLIITMQGFTPSS